MQLSKRTESELNISARKKVMDQKNELEWEKVKIKIGF